MSMDALNHSFDDGLFADLETEDMVLRRLSTYATLRSGDLTALLGHTHHGHNHHGRQKFSPAPGSLFSHSIRERSDSSCSNSSESDKEPESEGQVVTVRGQDIGEHPIEYTVRDLRSHEMPVIGVYVDPRIKPGFRYRVRRLGTDNYLFEGKPLTLQSMGMGYGKRFTFEGETLNFNDNYFWSDSEPNGFGFTLDAVHRGDTFTVYGSNGTGIIGEVKVERVVGHQEEISNEVVKGDVIKRCRVTMVCSVTYFHRHHGKMNLKLQTIEKLTGEAEVIKRRGQRQAALDCIYKVNLTRESGLCTLQNVES